MYRYANYTKIFEQANQVSPAAVALDTVPKDVLVSLTESDIARLDEAMEASSIFEIPYKGMTDPKVTGILYLAFKKPGASLTAEINSKLSELKNDPTNLIFQVETSENNKVVPIAGLEGEPKGTLVTVIFSDETKRSTKIGFIKGDDAKEFTQEPTSMEQEPSTQVDLAATLDSGQLTGANPKKYENTMTNSIKSFDEFLGEAKKEKWIGEIDMKKGALRKEMGKKKGEKLTAADIAKSEAALKKKDKDKKKPGLQLNKKDAKTHKRNVLAKNLMKASGAIKESKQEEIKNIKNQLVEIHKVVEAMIKKTSHSKK